MNKLFVTIRRSSRFLVFLLVLGSGVVFAATSLTNHQKIVPTTSPLYAAIKTLTLQQGLASPSSAGPWSIQELEIMIATIDSSKLSGYERKLYDWVFSQLQQAIRSPQAGFSGDVSLDFALETYLHANPNGFQTEADWYWDNEKRSPLAKVTAEGWFGSQVYLTTDFGIKKNRFAQPEQDAVPVERMVFGPFFTTNVVTMGLQDFDTPDRAFLAFGGDGFSFQFGRDLISWGYGATGNLVISDSMKYHEFTRLTLFAEKYKFTSLVMFFDPPGYTTKDRNRYVPANETDAMVRMFLAHRFEFNPTSSLHMEFSENVMYEDTYFNIKYLNPLFIFHNLSNRSQFNAIADLTFAWTVMPNLQVYGTVVIDQVVAPGEGSDQPNAMGYQLGVLKQLPQRNGTWVVQAECVYTEPYLYLRDSVDFVIMSRERDQYYGYVPQYSFLGYQYGGDALILDVRLAWNGLGKLSGGMELFGMAHGATSIDTPFVFGETPIIQTPSDPVTYTLRNGYWVSYALTEKSQLWTRIDGIARMQQPAYKPVFDIQGVFGFSYTW